MHLERESKLELSRNSVWETLRHKDAKKKRGHLRDLLVSGEDLGLGCGAGGADLLDGD